MILISPFVYLNQYKKVCYSINKEWENFSKKFKINLVIISHEINLNKLNKKKIKLIILSGGGDIYKIKKTSINKSRDKFDLKLINFGIKNNIPILAVCRSFQLIANFHGSKLYKKKSDKKHPIYFTKKVKSYDRKLIVNSYHLINIKTLPKEFDILAKNSNGFIEVAFNKNKKILCLMPHPEREFYSKSLIPLIKNYLIK